MSSSLIISFASYFSLQFSSLFVGAPTEKNRNQFERGKIYVAKVDRTCDDISFCDTFELKFNADKNSMAENVLSGINEQNIKLSSGFLGSTFKV